MKFEHYYANGRRLYAQHCQNCHAADGKGLGQLIPPLTDTILLKKNRHQLACLIKNGLSGKIIVNGKEYSSEMPANPALAPIDLAQLVTYITNSFGNKQGPYTVDQVQEDCK
jgi:mono/diheme cytochrome c family protein